MGIDGFNQTQYDQLVQQVRSGAPPARPAKFIMPGSKRPRVTKATTSSSANEDDDVGAAEVLKVLSNLDGWRLTRVNRTTRRLCRDRNEGQRGNIAPVLKTISVFQASVNAPYSLAIATSDI